MFFLLSAWFCDRLGKDFSASQGPDLDLFLSESQPMEDGAPRVKDLKAFSGAQNYALDGIVADSQSLADINYVTIYCVAFSVDFGFAELKSEADGTGE